MADGDPGIQLLGFSRKGSFFDNIPAEDQEQSRAMDKSTNQKPGQKSTPNSEKRPDKKSSKTRSLDRRDKASPKVSKSDTKRGINILSSGRSKMRDMFRRYESKQNGSSSDSSQQKSSQEDKTEGVVISEPVSANSSAMSLDPEDIQEFDEEGRRIITLNLDKPKDRGSKLLNALKSVPKIPPLKKRDSVVSIGSGSLKEEEEVEERPCFSPASAHFIPYTSGMEDTVEYHSEDSDSEYCYSGTLNENYVKPARTLSMRSTKSNASDPGQYLGQGQGYPGQGHMDLDQDFSDLGQVHTETNQYHEDRDQVQTNVVQSPSYLGQPDLGQGLINLAKGQSSVGQSSPNMDQSSQNVGRSPTYLGKDQPDLANGCQIQGQGRKDVEQGQRSDEGRSEGQVKELSETERRERISGGQTFDLRDDSETVKYNIVQSPVIAQDPSLLTFDAKSAENGAQNDMKSVQKDNGFTRDEVTAIDKAADSEGKLADSKTEMEVPPDKSLSQNANPQILIDKSEILRDKTRDNQLKNDADYDGKETDDEEEKSILEVANFDPQDPIRISLTSENTSDTEQDKENTQNFKKLNVIDYTRPRSYLICELEQPKGKKIPPKTKPKPKLKSKPKVPVKPKLKVKFSELVEKREMWMVREESAEKREDEDEEEYQRRISSTMSIEKTMSFGEEEEKAKTPEKRVRFFFLHEIVAMKTCLLVLCGFFFFYQIRAAPSSKFFKIVPFFFISELHMKMHLKYIVCPFMY